MPGSKGAAAARLKLLNETEGWNDPTETELAAAAEASMPRIDRALMVPIERIAPMKDNPRQSFRNLDELAESIEDRGIIQPLIVRRDPERPGHFFTIAGARRLMAANILRGSDDPDVRTRVATIPCLIVDESDDSALASALAENLAREDLTRAEAMDAMLRLEEQFGWSARQIARRTGRNDHDVAELLRVARDNELSSLVKQEVIAPTAAGHISSLPSEDRALAVEEIQAGRIRTVKQAQSFKAMRQRNRRQSPEASPPETYGQVRDITHLTVNQGPEDSETTASTPEPALESTISPAEISASSPACKDTGRKPRPATDHQELESVREWTRAVRAVGETHPILLWDPEVAENRKATEHAALKVSGKPWEQGPVTDELALAVLGELEGVFSGVLDWLGDLVDNPEIEAAIERVRAARPR